MNKPFFPSAQLPRIPVFGPQAYQLPSVRPLSDKVQALLKLPLSHFAAKSQGLAGEPLTYAAMVLDESTSMLKHRATALEGFNAQVSVITEGAKQAGKTRVSLTLFNTVSRPLMVARPVEELRPLTAEEYSPSGSTALYDAIGETLESLLEQPFIESSTTAVLVAIFTDGEENMSSRYDGKTLKELVSRLEATGRWTFTLMGPHGSSLELASVLNLQAGNVAMFNPNDAGSTRTAFAEMTKAAGSYMSLRSMGVTASASLYSPADDN